MTRQHGKDHPKAAKQPEVKKPPQSGAKAPVKQDSSVKSGKQGQAAIAAKKGTSTAPGNPRPVAAPAKKVTTNPSPVSPGTQTKPTVSAKPPILMAGRGKPLPIPPTRDALLTALKGMTDDNTVLQEFQSVLSKAYPQSNSNKLQAVAADPKGPWVSPDMPPAQVKEASGNLQSLPPTPLQTVAKNFKAYTVDVSKGDKDTQSRLKKIGVNYKTSASTVNKHAVAAAIREYSTAYAINHLYQQGVKHVISIFGSSRDCRIANRLNAGVPDKDRIHVYVYRPVIVPADITREKFQEYDYAAHGELDQEPIDPDSQLIVKLEHGHFWIKHWQEKELELHFCDRAEFGRSEVGFLLCNIYQWASEVPGSNDASSFVLKDHEFTPEILKATISNIGFPKAPVVWIGHQFPGEGGTIENASAWVRVDGKINHKSDDEALVYPPHSDVTWIHSDSSLEYVDVLGATQYFAWSRVARYSDTVLIAFKSIPVKPLTVSRLETKAQWERMRSVIYPYWVTSSILRFVPRSCFLIWKASSESVVYMPLVRKESDYLSGRTINSITVKSFCARLASTLESDSDYKLMTTLFPGAFSNIVENTAVYMLTRHQQHAGSCLSFLRNFVNDRFIQHNSDLDQIGAPQQDDPTRRSQRAWVVCAAVGAMLFFKNSAAALKRAAAKVFLSGASAVSAGLQNVVKATVVPAASLQDTAVAFDKVSVQDFGLGDYVGLLQEELFKKFVWWKGIPIGFLSLVTYEFLLTMVSTRSIFPESSLADVFWITFMRYSPAMVLHTTTMFCDLPYAILLHTGFNYLVKKHNQALGLVVPASSLYATTVFWKEQRRRPTLWTCRQKAFVEAYHTSPWDLRPEIDEHSVAITGYPSDEGILQKQSYPRYDSKPRDVEFLELKGTVSDARLQIFPEETTQVTFNFWMHNVPMYYAGRTRAMLEAVVDARLTTAPVLSPNEQCRNWEHLFTFSFDSRIPHESICLLWADNVQPWLDSIDDSKKKARAKAAFHTLSEEGMLDPEWVCDKYPVWIRRTEIMVKSDEALMKLTKTLRPQLKPRSIAVVDPKVQVLLGPVLKAATDRLLLHWPLDLAGDQYVLGRWKVSICYGGKATNKSLTEWLNKCLTIPPDHVVILVSGDDSLVIVNVDGHLFYFESDLSMCDISISKGPLEIEYYVLGLLGVSMAHTRLLRLLSYAQYQAGGLRISRTERPYRDTGGPDTSIGNTICVALSWYSFFQKCQEFTHLQVPVIRDFMQSLGFDVKVQIYDQPYEPTFLKGMWYASSEHRWAWAPLPSRVLKMGKSHTDPTSIYKHLSYSLACSQFGVDLAMSYLPYGEVPILNDLCNAMIKWPAVRCPQPMKLDAWKVQAAEHWDPAIDRDLAALQICSRYKMEGGTLLSLIVFLKSVRPFVFIEHPGFVDLALRDYT